MTDILGASDRLDLERVHAIAGLLDRTTDDLFPGAPLPLMWHACFLLPRPASAEIGPDGHPLLGFPTPPAPGLRRMFAGGRVRAGVLRVGAEVTATTRVTGAKEREGRAGPMHFRTTRTTLTVDGAEVLAEERDIVYLTAAHTAPAPAEDLRDRVPEEVGSAAYARSVDVDTVLLFRFSALTYNAHRIHYDRTYARDVEGHPGLVVHGPLQAVLMAEAGSALLGRSTGIAMEYRLVAPLYEQQGLHVVGELDGPGARVRVLDGSGRETARASITQTAAP